jgi:hypothetical protein
MEKLLLGFFSDYNLLWPCPIKYNGSSDDTALTQVLEQVTPIVSVLRDGRILVGGIFQPTMISYNQYCSIKKKCYISYWDPFKEQQVAVFLSNKLRNINFQDSFKYSQNVEVMMWMEYLFSQKLNSRTNAIILTGWLEYIYLKFAIWARNSYD